MRFYRNLGAITFQADIGSFQIFSAQPNTIIFQSKIKTEDFLLKDFVKFYQHSLKSNCVTYYQEDHKTYSIVISNCKKIPKIKYNTSGFCNLALEIANSCFKLSNIVDNKFYGDMTIQQILMINDKPIFIYLPIKQGQNNNSNQLCLSVIQLIKSLKNDEDNSQRLFIKKLQKCKTLASLIEEIIYFQNIYSVKNVKNSIKNSFNFPKKQISEIKNRSKHKLGIFPKEPRTFFLNESKINQSSKRSFFSQHRQPNKTLHISLTKTLTLKKGKSNYVSSSLKKSLRNQSNSKLKNTTTSQSFYKDSINAKSISKVLKSNLAQSSSKVSNSDEIKLLKKLKHKKLITHQPQKSIIQQQTKSKVNFQSKANTNLNININSQHNIQLQSKKKIIQQEYKSIQYPFQCIQSINIQNPSLVPQKNQLAIQLSQPIVKYEPISKNSSIHISKTSPIQNNLQSNLPIKKTYASYNYQQVSDEIQTIDLTCSNKGKKIQSQEPKKCQGQIVQIKKFTKKQSKKSALLEATQTRKNSWKQTSKKDSDPQINATVRLNNSHENLFIMDRKNLDYMGSAVVNTMNHLKNYTSILWQLPMFYLYKKFYKLRLQLSQKYRHIKQNQLYSQFMQENQKIKNSINKLSKIVIKKLKKDQMQLYKNIKNSIDLQQSDQFEDLFTEFVVQYMKSLSEASSKNPQLLLIHEIQIVDAYLVGKGIKIDEKARQKIQEKSQTQQFFYLKIQKSKLK